MTEEMQYTTVKYLVDQLVDVRVACQFWINKDQESQERIKELESTNHFDAAELYQKELVKAEKRVKELERNIEQLEMELQ